MDAQTNPQPRPKPQGHEDLNSHWVGAGHLKIGDKIKQADGTTGIVANVTTIQQTQEMFNLTVSEAHTFYVGQNGWLVHNCDPFELARNAATRGLPAPRQLGAINPDKYDYLFGKVASNAHNADRSNQLALEMKRLGINYNEKGIGILEEHFMDTLTSNSNISQTFSNRWGNFEVRESLLFGPSGKATMFETTWQILPDGIRRFSTTIPKSSKW